MHNCLFGDDVRLSPDIRGAFRKIAKKDLTVTSIAQMFNTTRQTVYRWLGRGKHRGTETFKDKPRQPKESKVTAEVELPILKTENYLQMGNRTHTTRPLQPATLHAGFCTLRPRNKLV